MAMGYKAQTFIDAIPGTDGIVSAIARKVGCAWQTAEKYILEYPSVHAAWVAERETILDLSESVLGRNIRLAQRAQEPTRDAEGKVVAYPLPVDTSDAKWMLSKRGKGRGYGDKLELDGSLNLTSMTLAEWRRAVTARRKGAQEAEDLAEIS
jgi:hypothetical protein